MPLSFLVASDTHGRADLLEKAFRRAKPDGVLFLGDGLRDLNILPADTTLRAVCGNCDWTAREDAPPVRVEQIAGYRIYMTHGHRAAGYMGLVYKAQELEARVAMFGHTHVPFCEVQQGVMLLNPGSAGNYCRGGRARASILEINRGQLRVTNMTL